MFAQTWCCDPLQNNSRVNVKDKNVGFRKDENDVQIGMKDDFMNVWTFTDCQVSILFEKIFYLIHFN